MRIAKQNETPEIFYTLQGEGRNVGEPATFMRLSGCNLHCVWCDTPYTWNWNGTKFEHDDDIKYERKEEQIRLEVGEALNLITGLKCERLVITGGEPLLQQREVVELITGLKAENPDYQVEIETNGTIIPFPELTELVDQFNVSPKLSNSGMQESKRIKDLSLSELNKTGKADFKFVIDEQTDLEEVKQIQERIGISPDHIYLMAQGRTEAEQEAKAGWVAEICKDNKYRFTPRLHIALWGSERGV